MCGLHVFVESSRNNVVDNETGSNRTADLCHKSVWLWRQRFSEKSFKKDIKRQPLGVSICQINILTCMILKKLNKNVKKSSCFLLII